MSQKVLSYDLGGTKIAVGVVNSKGRILEEIRVPARFEEGKTVVIQQLVDLGQQLLKNYPKIEKIGIASAGPLDPKKGILLDPTNFGTAKESWGKVPICQILSKKLKRRVFLENDAAAAVLAEHWIGAGQKYKNMMVLTLGTGLGTGIICNDALVRSGKNLHPEAGHIILRAHDASAPCGCGNLGCAEAFLSGRNFARRAQQLFLGISNGTLDAKKISDLARQRDPRALAAFEEYAAIMSVALYNYVRIYSPEIIIFTGSFAAAFPLFIHPTQKHLKQMLSRERKNGDLLPQLAVSSLNNEAGLIGGAHVAFKSRNEPRKR